MHESHRRLKAELQHKSTWPQSLSAEISCCRVLRNVFLIVNLVFNRDESFPFRFISGQTHNASFHLFRLNDYVTAPVRIFAESGHAHYLEEDLARKNSAIYDEFHLPKVPKGQGATGGTFFVDGLHTKVSFITKIVPSPDWFIGLDSYNVRLNFHFK